MAIQNRRGAFANFDPSKMLPGEFAVVQSGDTSTSDGKSVYIAFQSGQVKKLATYTDIQDAVESATDELIEEVTQGLEEDVQRAEEAARTLTIDNTLTQSGQAADAKKTGDEIADVKEDLSDIWEEIGGQANVSGNMVHLEGMQSGQEADGIVIKVMPIQAGTGAPSASNVRTISGRSSVTITQLKKNILTFFIDGYVPSVSTGKLVQAGGARSDYIPANELTKYTITLERTSGATTEIYAFYYDKNKTFLSQDNQLTSGQTTNTLTFSTPAKTAFIMCRLGSGNNISTFVSGQMEFGNEATAYEAYNATQYTIDLSNYAPIYGATIDVTNGTLTITHGYIASYAGESIGSPWISSKDVYSEGALPSTGAQVVYPLSTPVEYSITPQPITFFDGINNIYSNSGETSVGIDSLKEGSIAEKVANLEKDKIDKQQGATNAGKVLAVGSDGVVVPIDPSSFGLSNDIKVALLNCFRHVVWVDEHGQDYYDALKVALNPRVLSSISAVFTQGQHVVYADDSLDSLKQYLVVTAHYADQTTATVLGYTLSGTLTVGTSVITVTYEDKTTTFNVTVTASPYIYDYSASSGVNPPDMTGTSFDFSEDPGAVKVLVPNLTIPISSNNWEAEMECKFDYREQENNPKVSLNGYVSETDNLNIILQPNATASSASDRTKLAYTINWASNTKTFTDYTFSSYRVYRIVYNNGTFNVYIDNSLVVSSGKIDSSSHVNENAFKIVCATSSISASIYIKTLKVKTL